MILTEKEISERLVGLDLPPSIKEAIQDGLKGVSTSSEQLAEIISLVAADYSHSKVES